MYNAGAVLGLTDAELVRVALRDVLEGCVPGVVPRDVRVVDSSVLRFKAGVTKFAPGTASLLPKTRVGGLDNFFVAGDYVWQGPDSHGARGLSQEKALVSGLCAADAAAEWARRKTGRFDMSRGGKASVIRQTAPDEDHVAAAKVAARAVDELERSNPIARLIKETTTGGGIVSVPGRAGMAVSVSAAGVPLPSASPGVHAIGSDEFFDGDITLCRYDPVSPYVQCARRHVRIRSRRQFPIPRTRDAHSKSESSPSSSKSSSSDSSSEDSSL